MSHTLKTIAVVCCLAVAPLTACGKLRSLPPECPDYAATVDPLLSKSCASCHGGTAPAGQYRVRPYEEAVAARSDGSPRLVPGDKSSLILVKASGSGGHPAATAQELEVLNAWVACRAPSRDFDFHLPGWLNPGDALQFHGRVLREQAYSMKTCRTCHGDDFTGGSSRASCFTCHSKGPLACDVCHGDATSSAPPRGVDGARRSSAVGVGAHRSHVTDGPLHKAYGCATCHREVLDPEQERHYQNSGHLDPSPAEVRILAQSSGPTALAEWNRTAATCTNVKCHAPSVDSTAQNQRPVWTSVDAGQAGCGSCHGLPPSSHATSSTQCEVCHPTVASGQQVIAPALHADGVVQLGDGSGGCSACHGDATSPAPPRDVSGNTDAGAVTVGAHRAHLFASRFRGPMECSECHQVPLAVSWPGHLDDALPAEVFPDLADRPLARADGARPTWNRAAATCSGVYCHGGGVGAARDHAVSLSRTPIWTSGPSAVFCGSCHGIPPDDNFHPAGTPLTECYRCHRASIGPDAGFVTEPATDGGSPRYRHLDGVVQLGASL